MNKLLSIFLVAVFISIVSYFLRSLNFCETYLLQDSAITNPASW